MVLTLNSLLTDEIRGGLWKQDPVSLFNASSTSLISSTGLWNLITPTYSFPADCCDFTSLVALLIQTIRHPVTLGSSVPECPKIIKTSLITCFFDF